MRLERKNTSARRWDLLGRSSHHRTVLALGTACAFDPADLRYHSVGLRADSGLGSVLPNTAHFQSGSEPLSQGLRSPSEGKVSVFREEE